MISFKPEPYQEIAREHLHKNNCAALYMGCGMGKTATVLSVASDMLLEACMNGVLVIAPLRVANLTWLDEVNQFEEFSWMSVANLRTKEGLRRLVNHEAHIYTINYESLPKFCKWFEENMSDKDMPFDTVVFDELTMTKGLKGFRNTKNNSKRLLPYMKTIFPRVKRSWGLTGTPITNNLQDLYGQTLVLDGGERFGPTFNRFRDIYFYPADYHKYEWKLFPHHKGKIEEKVSDMALSLKREDWLDIPDISFEDVTVAMDKETSKVYKELRKHYCCVYKQHEITAESAGVLVQKLLQIVGGACYDDNREVVHLDEKKILKLKSLVKQIKDPVLVGCNYIHEQDRIRRHFPQAYFVSDCKNDEQESELIRKWNDKEIPMLVAHPKSLGHGLNLQHGGKNIIWYTLPWSRELYDQFNCRLSRKGQEHTVKVHRLMTPGSIDDAVAEALRHKHDEQQMFLDTLENLTRIEKLF